MIKRTLRRPLAWAAPLALLAIAPVSHADVPGVELRFEPRVKAATPASDTLHLSHFPALQVVVTPARSTPDDVAAQLTAAVNAETTSHGGPGFDAVAGFLDYKLNARTDPRKE